MSSTRQRGRHHVRWYRKITPGHVVIFGMAVVLLFFVYFGIQAARASSSLKLAASQAEVLQSQIVSGDDVSAKATLKELQQSTARADQITSGSMWRLGAKLPFVGDNVEAVQTVARVTHNISTDALPPVVELSNKINLNTYSPRDGKIDIKAIQEISPNVGKVVTALTAARKELRGIDANSLLLPLRDPVSTIQEKVGSATAAADSANLAAKLLPDMLGQKGTRRYLLMVQNNAEIRSTGGIPGSIAILKAKNGKLSMGFQGSYQDLKQFSEPVLPMTRNEDRVFPPTLVTNLLDTTITPDFPRTAEIVTAMVEKGLDTKVDGVISVDPVALSYVLAGTGPVALTKTAIIDQNNAVELLLSQTYLLLKDPEQQDGVFELAARKIFDVVKAGRGEPRLVIDGLVRSARENRLMVWSTHKSEQALLTPSALSGQLSGNGGRVPHVGLYIGDAASTKMEYYLDYSTSLAVGRCLRGDVQELTTTTDLSSRAPEKLPKSVTGDGKYTPRGTMRLLLRFYSPYAGGFTSVKVDGKDQTVYADTHRGRNVTKVLLTVHPHQSYKITTSMISGPGEDGDPVFSTTPGVDPTPNDIEVKSACS